MENLSSQEFESKAINFIKNDDIEGLYCFFQDLPVGTQMDIKPKFISFTIYKLNCSDFQIDCTAGQWLSTTTDKKLLCLFLFGKVDSTFFKWT